MFTLVPSHFFNPEAGREALAEVVDLPEGAEVHHLDIPQYGAVLVYSDGDGVFSNDAQRMAEIITCLGDCPEYNKILCSIEADRLYIAIAQGKSLLLANAYPAPDFVTAQYYIYYAMKSLQLNPEVSTVCWRSPLSSVQEMSLYRYFKSVVCL